MTNEELLAELEVTDLATVAQLNTIATLVDLQIAREGVVSKLEEQLKTAKASLLDISDKKLPEAMKAARTKVHVTDDGRKIELKEDMKISVPKKRLAEIVEKLRTWDCDDLIANTLTCEIDKGKDNLAAEVMSAAEALGLEMTRSQSVNSSSLKSMLKTRQKEAAEGNKDKNGKEIEPVTDETLTFFGAFPFTTVKITQ